MRPKHAPTPPRHKVQMSQSPPRRPANYVKRDGRHSRQGGAWVLCQPSSLKKSSSTRLNSIDRLVHTPTLYSIINSVSR